MRSYVIGRSPYADIVLPDPSVARRHAELVATDDGRFHLTDCDADGGTWRGLGGRGSDGASGEPQWERLRQAFVAPETPLRFGEHRATLRELLGLAAPAAPGAPGRWRWEGLAGKGDEPAVASAEGGGRKGAAARPRGKVERDPVTGEIVAKRW